MKWLIMGLLVITASFSLLLIQQSRASQSVMAKGVADGKLSRCPARPNCVCTEYPMDTNHYIAPMALSAANQHNAIAQSATIIGNMGGIVTLQTRQYLSATFTSKLFNFVDDVEIRQDENTNTLHLRSASRAGYSDMGVNKERAENFFRQWQQ